MDEVRCLLEIKSILGEGPIWRPRDNAVYWIDLKKPAIYCFDVITKENRQLPAALAETIGGIVFARDGRMIVVDLEGIHELNSTGHRQLLVHPEAHLTGNSFNDAKCDHRGRLWTGSADIGETRASGNLYLIDGQRNVRQVDSGFICSNGPAFSPDGKRVYFTDSFAQEVYYYDIDPHVGLISQRKSFVKTDPKGGYPDGMTVDSEGYLWNAMWDGWCIIRYAPDGRVNRVVKVPVPRPTAMCFGGARMDQMYITSASVGLTDEQLKEAPLSGSLFIYEPRVRGLPDVEYLG